MQWADQQAAELSQEQYAAMNPEQQAAYWAQWQYYAQYYDQQQQQQYPAAQYQQPTQVTHLAAIDKSPIPWIRGSTSQEHSLQSLWSILK
jgi:hypothetical protein